MSHVRFVWSLICRCQQGTATDEEYRMMSIGFYALLAYTLQFAGR